MCCDTQANSSVQRQSETYAFRAVSSPAPCGPSFLTASPLKYCPEPHHAMDVQEPQGPSISALRASSAAAPATEAAAVNSSSANRHSSGLAHHLWHDSIQVMPKKVVLLLLLSGGFVMHCALPGHVVCRKQSWSLTVKCRSVSRPCDDVGRVDSLGAVRQRGEGCAILVDERRRPNLSGSRVLGGGNEFCCGTSSDTQGGAREGRHQSGNMLLIEIPLNTICTED